MSAGDVILTVSVVILLLVIGGVLGDRWDRDRTDARNRNRRG